MRSPTTENDKIIPFLYTILEYFLFLLKTCIHLFNCNLLCQKKTGRMEEERCKYFLLAGLILKYQQQPAKDQGQERKCVGAGTQGLGT